MKRVRPMMALRIGLTGAIGLLAGCQTSQYAGSVTNFSTAVGSASIAHQAIAEATIAVRNRQIDLYLAAHPEAQASVATTKCNALDGYKAGDCAIRFGTMALDTDLDHDTEGLVRYATALNAVVNDKSAATLGTDVGNLGSAIQGLTTTLGDEKLATDAGPIATIVEQLGALAIEARQIEILRKATAAADPLVAQLADHLGTLDAKRTHFVIDQQTIDLRAQVTAFNQNPRRQAADLAALVQRAAAIDRAQQIDPKAALAELARLHHTLTQNLANPTLNWGVIQGNAQALVQTLQTVSAAAKTLAAADTGANAASGTH